MIYLVYRMHLTARARQNMKEFWAWLEDRERFFYDDLDMVKELRWYYSVVGDVYVIENWAGFEDEAGWGAVPREAGDAEEERQLGGGACLPGRVVGLPRHPHRHRPPGPGRLQQAPLTTQTRVTHRP